MDKCTYCAGGGGSEAPGSAEEFAKYGSDRFGEAKLPLCAEMCSTRSLLAGGEADRRDVSCANSPSRRRRAPFDCRSGSHSSQKLGPDGAPNPTASVVDEQTLLKQAPSVEGRTDIPDPKASVLIEPARRTWEYFHEVLLHRVSAIAILGTIAILGLA